MTGLWFVRRPGFPAGGKQFPGHSVRSQSSQTPLWIFAHQSAIASADVVIAVGGTVGTRNAGFIAENMNVPVLALSSFGGGAQELHEYLESRMQALPDASHLSAPWPQERKLKQDRELAKSRAEAIIRLAEALGRHSYFLSFAHTEMGWCDFVHLALNEHMRTVLRDRNQLRIGRPVVDRLYEAIGRAETFLLLWSAESSKSKWCRAELDVAARLHRLGLC